MSDSVLKSSVTVLNMARARLVALKGNEAKNPQRASDKSKPATEIAWPDYICRPPQEFSFLVNRRGAAEENQSAKRRESWKNGGFFSAARLCVQVCVKMASDESWLLASRTLNRSRFPSLTDSG